MHNFLLIGLCGLIRHCSIAYVTQRKHALTHLSRRLAQTPAKSAKNTPPRAGGALERSSLIAGLSFMCCSCLVLSAPEFEEPDQTPPFLIATAADPDPREFVLVLDEDKRKDFGAAVLSEDRGEPVQVALYIDYGISNAAGHPFFRSIAEFPEIPAGTMAEGPRAVSTQWFLDTANVEPGCHSVTMIVTHHFDYRNCPKRMSDSSQLQWKVLRCATTDTCPTIDPVKDCPNSQENPLSSCPPESSGETTMSQSAGDL